MPTNNEEITVEKYEFELTQSFELGIGAGFERAGEYLEKAAIELFKKHLDSDAIKIRILSDDLKKIGNEKANLAREKQL